MARSMSVLGSGVTFLAMIVAPVSAAVPASPRLSPAQVSAIARAIATLEHPEERTLASHWTDAKKVAEFICRPLATTILARRSQADRVFLGTDDTDTLHLLSDRRLEGSGQYRAGDDWQSFTFSCTLDPRNGTATAFDTTPAD